jgi:hypothetical protein
MTNMITVFPWNQWSQSGNSEESGDHDGKIVREDFKNRLKNVAWRGLKTQRGWPSL